MDPITSPILIFAIIALVILAAPLLAQRLRIPDIVLLMAAGAALGPYGFGWIPRNSAITLFGEVGLVYIMFLSGLEIDLYEFNRTRRRSVGFGLITFLFPQVLGTLAVWYFLGTSWSAALLVASMFASHTLLAYPIASRLGIQKTEPVTVTVGATIVTNVLSLLVLAVVVDAAGGAEMDALFWLRIGIGMAVLVFITWYGIPKLARWFFQNVTESSGSQFMFVLSVTCACAYFSNYARMEPIIGAFLAGAAFNRLIPERSPLMNRLSFAGNTLFIPFFLISVGMLVNPGAMLGDLEVWQVIGVMVGMVIITKAFAAWIGGALFRYNRAETTVVFGLSVVQAAATLAAVLVGLRVELLNQAFLNGAIGMILVTVIVGAAAVERGGRRMALGLLQQQATPGQQQRILLSVANPFSAARLLDLSLLLRDPQRHGALYPTTIVREQGQTDDAVARGEQLLAQCISAASHTDEDIIPSVRVDLNPADGILRAAQDLRADLVLTGWGGEHTPSARIFGSVNRNLTENCPTRVMLCRLLQPTNTNKNLRLPIPPLTRYRADLPELIRDAKRLCKQLSTELTLYVHGEEADLLRTLVDELTPACPSRIIEADTWSAARARLFADVRDTDLILLPQERKNSVLWTPTLDRIPELIASRFPKTNFIVAYPPLPAETAELPLPGEEKVPRRFPDCVPVELSPGMAAEDAIREVVRIGSKWLPIPTDDAAAQLCTSARHHPLEMGDGILLLHAHSGEHPTPLLIVARGQLAHPFFDQPQPPKTLLCLLSPKGQPPETHLRALAAVAERLHRPEQLQHLQQTPTAAAFAEALSGAPPSF